MAAKYFSKNHSQTAVQRVTFRGMWFTKAEFHFLNPGTTHTCIPIPPKNDIVRIMVIEMTMITEISPLLLQTEFIYK